MKRPLEGPIQPDDHDDSENKALPLDWGVLKPSLDEVLNNKLPEEDRDGAVLREAEKMEHFIRKHKKRLAKGGRDMDANLALLTSYKEDFAQAVRKEDEQIQRQLDSQAKVAETGADLTEQLHVLMRWLERRTPEEWDALDWEIREKQKETLARLQAEMPAMLARLPLEKRRALEEQP